MKLDLEDWYALGVELARMTNDINDPASLRSAVSEEGRAIRDSWREHATATSGAHGKHYPSSITYETKTVGPLVVQSVVGPESERPQGGMSFEFGSRNQPPHLSGQRAASEAEGRIEDRMIEWLDGVGL